jgi:two-component system chemotaxis response regulator CheB
MQHTTPSPLAGGAAPYVVAFGASSGGLRAISSILADLPGSILANLPAGFHVPIVIVQHLSPPTPSRMADIPSRRTALRVKAAQEGDRLQAGAIYVAPPAGRLTVRPNDRLSLSDSESEAEEDHSHSAVDALFLPLAGSLQARAIGMMLAGGEDTGADRIRAIKSAGGVTLAQAEKARRRASMWISC